MDSAAYSRQATATANVPLAYATFAVINLGTEPAYTQRGCEPVNFAVDTGGPGRWVEFAGDASLAICPMTVEAIGPGDSARATFTWDFPATYRIRVIYGRDQAAPFTLQSAGAAFAIH